MKNIITLAKELKINKVCINGQLKDVRQYDNTPFMVVPKYFDVIDNSILYEPILFCYTK